MYKRQARIAALNEWATDGLVPDLTVLIDVDAATAADRRDRRAAEGEGTPDRMERETADRHEALRAAFLARAAAAPERYLVLDGALPPQELTARALARVTAQAADR